MSLSSGQSPILNSSSSSFPYDSNAVPMGSCGRWSTHSDSEQRVDGLVDCRVAAIFRDLQHLARRTNKATSGQESELHAGLWTAQYRLFQLAGGLDDIVGECLRVAMLTFLATTFQVLGSRIRYEHVTNRFRVLCCAIETSTQQLQELMFWMLMVGTMVLFDHDEPWLCEIWRFLVLPLTRGQEWVDVQGRLQSFIWINVSNESIGKQTFEKMRRNLGQTPQHPEPQGAPKTPVDLL